ncbi:hypothetical protein [Mesorhizobium sp. A623]
MAVGSILLSNGMMAAAKGLGAGIGAAIRETRNARRTNDWNKAVTAKAEEVDALLAEYDQFRKDTLSPYVHLSRNAVEKYMVFRRMKQAAYDGRSLYDCYDVLAELVTLVRNEIANARSMARKMSNELIKRQVAKRIAEAVAA